MPRACITRCLNYREKRARRGTESNAIMGGSATRGVPRAPNAAIDAPRVRGQLCQRHGGSTAPERRARGTTMLKTTVK